MSSSNLSRTSSWKDITPGSLERVRPAGAEGESTGRQQNPELMWRLMNTYLSNDVLSLQKSVVHHVEHTLACTRFDFDELKAYLASAHSVRDRLVESWNDTNAHFNAADPKRVSYLSLEFLIGRSFQNALMNMELEANYSQALCDFGFTLETLYEQERDAALGNGGLGRLAACFLDSMATLNLPAWGYGIRYTYGIFRQEIVDGQQVENPDYWLNHGNPFEVERPDVNYPVRFYGEVTQDPETGRYSWTGGEMVQAMAYDTPIPGYDTFNTINLRLWRSAPAKEFDLASFNAGDYLAAVAARQRAESITHVLYPSDSTYSGKELRLKQQYFFVAATLRDIIRRFKKKASHVWAEFSDKNAIQLNDTHPSIGVPELFRILMDEEGLSMDEAWPIVEATFAYTNHTIMPEALEKWPVDLLGHLLPRHLQIIYDINWRFLQTVEARWPGDMGKMEKLSIVSENPKSIRMAHLAIVCSHKVNGVAALHTELLVNTVFPEFCELYPSKFTNMTNGVTPRRWIQMSNPGLGGLFTKWLGSDGWLGDLSQLEGLRQFADNAEMQTEWRAVKLAAKEKLAAYVQAELGVTISTSALFDVQVKRIHEYKRQYMNCLYCVLRYLQIKRMTPEEKANVVPRVTMFGGKAAPGYAMAKKIIKLIHDVGAVVNNDPDIGDLFKVLFLPDYRVTTASIIIPASDVSQHISTAGMEASGTSNMKFAMNGGLIIGTLDGANVEMAEEAGIENLFIFGTRCEDVDNVRLERRFHGAGPLGADLASVIDQLQGGVFCPHERVQPLLHALRPENDYYLLTADFDSYVEAQNRIDVTYKDVSLWTRMSIMTAAGMGKFSTDRTIAQYAKEIWGVEACERPDPRVETQERRQSMSSPGGAQAAVGEEAPEF